MAFWNQNRRRRAAQVLLTFFLMCISISLLFVAISLPQWSHTHPQGSVTGRAGNKGGAGVETTPTVIVQITQGPETKPTTTVVVPGQITPTPAAGTSSCTTPDAQVNVNTTTYSNAASPQPTAKIANTPVSQRPSPVTHKAVTSTPGTQAETSTTPTPSATAIASPTTQPTITVDATATGTPVSTQPVESTPTGTATISPTMTSTVSSTPTSTDSGTGGTPPRMPAQEQSGGGPINLGTPVSASPVPGITPTGTTQHIGGGWISPCNSNDIGMATGANIMAILWQHVWLILGASLACTALFYIMVRRIRL